MTETSYFTHLVSCEGGLNTQDSSLTLGRPQYNGLARRLINFEPWRGYRRISGITQFGGTTGFAAYSGIVRGVAVFNNKIMAARETASGVYSWYEQAPGGGTWNSLVGGITLTAGQRIRSVKFGFSGKKIAVVDGTGFARSYDGATFTTLNGAGAPANPKYVTEFKNRLVLAGYTAKPYAVTISAPNDETNYAGASGAIEINVGDVVVQVMRFRDQLIVFCENSIKKIVGDTSANFTLLPVTLDLGCSASDSVIELGGSLYFWAGDGIRQINSTDNVYDLELSTISKSIDHTVEDLTSQGYVPSQIVTAVIHSKTQFRMFFSSSTTTNAASKGILGALVGPSITGQVNPGDFKFNFAELQGINPVCCDSGFISGTEYVVHGGWNGNVYRQEQGNTFDGTAIPAVYLSPFMDLQDPFVRKRLERLIPYLNLEGDATIYFKLHFDFDDEAVLQPANSSQSLTYTNSVYDDASTTYGVAVYGGQSNPTNIMNIQGSCKTVSIGITSVDNQASFHIMGFALEYSNEGRH